VSTLTALGGAGGGPWLNRCVESGLPVGGPSGISVRAVLHAAAIAMRPAAATIDDRLIEAMP
jgi:hypothetical protein